MMWYHGLFLPRLFGTAVRPCDTTSWRNSGYVFVPFRFKARLANWDDPAGLLLWCMRTCETTKNLKKKERDRERVFQRTSYHPHEKRQNNLRTKQH